MELCGSNWKYSGGGGVLTVHQSVEDELAVLLHQVVDVAENATIGREVHVSLLLTVMPIAFVAVGAPTPFFSAGRSWMEGKGRMPASFQESGERNWGETYHMLIQRNRRP